MKDTGERLITEKGWWKNHLAEHIARYNFVESYTESKVVLDAGCGTGYGSSFLAGKGVKKIIGIDVSNEAIMYSKKKYRKYGNLDFFIMDCTNLGFEDNFFDVICCFEVIEHIAQYEKCLSELRRILKTNGTLIMSTPNALMSKGKSNPYHVKEFDIGELQQIMRKYFQNIEMWGINIINQPFLVEEAKAGQRIDKLNNSLNNINFIPWMIRRLILKAIWKILLVNHGYLYLRLIQDIRLAPSSEDVKISKEGVRDARSFICVCEK